MDRTDDFAVYDRVLDEPMANLGWQTEHISWRSKNVDWDDYHAVIIRSPWDYQDDAPAFLKVLEAIESSSAVLLNSMSIVEWNINKQYLKEVEAKGVKIVPSLWRDEFDFDEVESFFNHFSTEQIVIKPTVSANSDNTFWLKRGNFGEQKVTLDSSLANRQIMIQPFIKNILEQGEYSLFYFADQYSHCILKTPKSGDFRVQEEHGGILKSHEPCEKLHEAGQKALTTIPEKVLYARVDLVLHENDFKIMEIELIEPSLYFPFSEDSPQLFCQAFNEWMQNI